MPAPVYSGVWCSVRAQACVTVRGWAAACVDVDTPADATGYLPTIYCELSWGDIPQCGGGESDGRDMDSVM